MGAGQTGSWSTRTPGQRELGGDPDPLREDGASGSPHPQAEIPGRRAGRPGTAHPGGRQKGFRESDPRYSPTKRISLVPRSVVLP
ncbi:MAG TPA: hypothetical protein DD727_06410 [Clostridiales bacterium]|nr:hypothetical protein [Clostridiales bacterium]